MKNRWNRVLNVGGRNVGDGQPCFLAAEIGINHNGDLVLAKESILAAKESGADAVKFQNYHTEDFVSDPHLTYRYISQGREVVESQYEMFKRCELSNEDMKELKTFCEVNDVRFHSTPTHETGIQQLVEIGTDALKNGSDFLTHLPLIHAMGHSGLPTVLSTGMATADEIHEAVNAFADTGNTQLVLLACTSCYPAAPEDIHLRKLQTLQSTFGCLVGFSDHSEGIIASIGAVALGACWIEKHFTLNKTLPGPDHRFAADPEEFCEMEQAVRIMERSLGNSSLQPSGLEMESRNQYRLSCIASRTIQAGESLSKSDIAYSRPGTGLPPKEMLNLVGRTAGKRLEQGAMIHWEDIQ